MLMIQLVYIQRYSLATFTGIYLETQYDSLQWITIEMQCSLNISEYEHYMLCLQ